jgi:hypothetical protein
MERVGGPSLLLPPGQSLELPGRRVNVQLLLPAERVRLVPLVLRDSVHEILSRGGALPARVGGLQNIGKE